MKIISVIMFILTCNNFVMANEYEEINKVAKKIYMHLKNNCQSNKLAEFEFPNFSQEEIDDLQEIFKIKLSILEKNIALNKLIHKTIFSSIFTYVVFFVYIPLMHGFINCQDDECYSEIINKEAYSVLICLGILADNLYSVAKNFNKLNDPIKCMPEKSLDLIEKLLIVNNSDWFKEILIDIKNNELQQLS